MLRSNTNSKTRDPNACCKMLIPFSPDIKTRRSRAGCDKIGHRHNFANWGSDLR